MSAPSKASFIFPAFLQEAVLLSIVPCESLHSPHLAGVTLLFPAVAEHQEISSSPGSFFQLSPQWSLFSTLFDTHKQHKRRKPQRTHFSWRTATYNPKPWGEIPPKMTQRHKEWLTRLTWCGRAAHGWFTDGWTREMLLQITASSEQDRRTNCNKKIKLWPLLERVRESRGRWQEVKVLSV